MHALKKDFKTLFVQIHMLLGYNNQFNLTKNLKQHLLKDVMNI
jgi:hypothetical protein